MTALAISSTDAAWQEGYVGRSCEVTGVVRSVMFQPDGYSLWRIEATLTEGAELRWGGAPHGDEALFVLQGELEVDQIRCGPETTIVIESDATACVRATAPTTLLHFGPSTVAPPSEGLLGPPLEGTHGLHVIPLESARRLNPATPDIVRYYADSTCETCRIAFFKVSMTEANVTQSHVHSEDEIIHVLTGELHLGRKVVSAGMSVAIPGNYRYGFRTPAAFSFLNFRRDAATYVAAPGSTPILETVDAWRAVLAPA